ncbi:MAG: hypothetical protein SOX79_06540 [Candidatus Egerieousia sp.]|nr:hypothetical protein [Candidatus Egerieousia sp.]
MNIIIKPYNPQEGLFYFKPDTTLNRDYTNLYLPHFIKRVEAKELFYTRIDRAGKGIAERYASRYFSKGNYALSISIAPDIFPNAAPSQAPNATPNATPSQAPSTALNAPPSQAPSATPSAAPNSTPSQAASATPSQAPSATQSAAIINGSVANSIDYSFYSMPAEKIEDPQLIEQFCKYIAQITEIISLRTGDIIAIETGKKEYFSIEDSLPIPTSNSSSTSERLSNKETDPKAEKQEPTGTRRCQITCFPNLAPVNIIF